MKEHIPNSNLVLILSKNLTLGISVTGLEIYAWVQLFRRVPTYSTAHGYLKILPRSDLADAFAINYQEQALSTLLQIFAQEFVTI